MKRCERCGQEHIMNPPRNGDKYGRLMKITTNMTGSRLTPTDALTGKPLFFRALSIIFPPDGFAVARITRMDGVEEEWEVAPLETPIEIFMGAD